MKILSSIIKTMFLEKGLDLFFDRIAFNFIACTMDLNKPYNGELQVGMRFSKAFFIDENGIIDFSLDNSYTNVVIAEIEPSSFYKNRRRIVFEHSDSFFYGDYDWLYDDSIVLYL